MEDPVSIDTQFAKFVTQLEQEAMRRNTITLQELRKFAPLFQKASAERLGQPTMVQHLEQLMSEYQERFSPTHPIIVVDDARRPVALIPPRTGRLDTLTGVHPIGSQVVDGLHIGQQRKDHTNHIPRELSDATSALTTFGGRLLTPSIIAQNESQAKALADLFGGNTDATAPLAPSPSVLNSIEWD